MTPIARLRLARVLRAASTAVLACAGAAATVPALAAKPCEAVAGQINELASYKETNKALLRRYQDCLAAAEVCSLTQEHDGTDGMVLSGTAAGLVDDGLDRSSVMTAYQDERAGTCLFVIHTGGSAASWLFHGWSVRGGRAEPIPQMERFSHRADFESTHALVGLLGQARAWALARTGP
jgi:hypothetical protein